MRAAAIKNVKMADETEEKGPDYSTEDSCAPPDAGRLRKLNSNLGIAHRRWASIGHMQTEAILDNSEENKKRGSLASNISNFSRGGAVGAALFWVKLNMPQSDLQKADSGRHLTHNVKAKDGKSM